MNKWDSLSMKERAELIKIGVQNGITDLQELRNYYNKFDDGGFLDRAVQAVKAGYNKIKKYFEEPSGFDYIDLSNQNVARIRSNTQNVNSILANEFVEGDNPNTIRKAKDFIATRDTLLGDRNIPLSKISQYYGIEDNKLKVGDLNIFNPETTVIPNRAKNIGKVKKVLPAKKLPNDQKETLQNKLDSLTNKRINDRTQQLESLADSLNLEPTFFNYFNGILTNKSPKELAGLDYTSKNKIPLLTSKDLIEQIKLTKDKLYPKSRLITEQNDTIQMPYYFLKDKMMFADEVGNSIFINNLNSAKQEELDIINQKLDSIPMYPILIDNGRYSDYYKSTSPTQNYTTYTWQDLYRDPQSLFIIGTTKNK